MHNPGFLYPKAQKRWGQNFFSDAELLAEALEPMNLQPDDAVLEIGPGRGILTEILLEAGVEVLALEIDPELSAILIERFSDQPRLKLLNQDFISFDLAGFKPELPLERRKLIANIPYHLTSSILMKVLNEPGFRQGIDASVPYFSDICLMVQQEVADKLLAEPGSKAYNALSVTVRYAAEAEQLAYLPRELFEPVPNVDSALIRLRPRTAPAVSLDDIDVFWRLLERCYQLRRKTLRNVLKSLGLKPDGIAGLETLTGIDLVRRGETLSLEEFAELANGLGKVEEGLDV